ncbi:Ig-like domain-containing protein [Neobacillus cucumis]|uniref:Lytic transglycosylase domain-containing protein n=1 Tax=Neobacillus cucumis TaxID=1740721 RepID=A0A2N5HA28_9BACI|nr:Ig-like domain-containing protein [Neobacillus cucumis]PLS02368.1 lytic transglycosylase domain-containing protein [Neobacillus cucumis]
MKLPIVRTGLLAGFMLLGFSHEKASAQTVWPAQCTTLGKVQTNQNPSFQQVNCLLTKAAVEAKIPPEVVKAIAAQESGWRQFTDDGQPFISTDDGIGIMQITNQSSYDVNQLKDDIYYNIKAGVEILSGMYHRTDLPKIKGAGPEVIENWYFPVMAYNGTKPVNSPLKQDTGIVNDMAYQEKVFDHIFQDSYLEDTKLAQFPFSVGDFKYQTDSTNNIEFLKKEYIISDQMHPSNYRFKAGDKVIVTKDGAKLRPQPGTSSSWNELTKGTPLTVEGDFVYDQESISNQFVWYPVKTADQKLTGYISSAYITNKLDSPKVGPVDDNNVSISGTAPSNVTIQVMSGAKVIGTAVTDGNGAFKVTIPVQKAGTQLTIFYKDQYNAPSTPTTKGITDKTAPASAVVNTVNNKAAAVTGKTESNATVTATIAGKAYTTKADGYGNYHVDIPVQNAGTSISVTAKDLAGNVSVARTMKVVKVAPNIPTVYTVNNKAAAVTGKTEANATVTATIAGKAYTVKADKLGNYKVTIPVQNTGTKLSVTAKDSLGHVSVARSTTVIRVAPNQPTVNIVRYYSTNVTGKTEKYATVAVKIGTRTYTAKANVYGNYKVYIPKQRVGTKVYVYAKDAKGMVSATRLITVSK